MHALFATPQRFVPTSARRERGAAGLPTGWKARGAVWSHHIAPDLTERSSANVVQKSQMENAPATLPPASGSVQQPMQAGTGVDGGVRARMARKAREQGQ